MSLLHNTTRSLRGLLQRSRPAPFARLLMTAALLGGSTSAILTGPAQAALFPSPCSFGVNTDHPPTCSTNNTDWYSSSPASDKEVQFITLPKLDPIFGGTPLDGVAKFDSTGGTWQVMFMFDNSVSGGQYGYTDYTIQITDPLYTLASVNLSVLGTDGGSSIKEVYSTSDIGNPAYLIGAINQTIPGASSGPLNLSGYSQVWVRDSFSSVSSVTGAAVNGLQNNFKQQSTATPGPLPLLGAGAAFGFSRRLRSRLRSAGLAA